MVFGIIKMTEPAFAPAIPDLVVMIALSNCVADTDLGMVQYVIVNLVTVVQIVPSRILVMGMDIGLTRPMKADIVNVRQIGVDPIVPSKILVTGTEAGEIQLAKMAHALAIKAMKGKIVHLDQA